MSCRSAGSLGEICYQRTPPRGGPTASQELPEGGRGRGSRGGGVLVHVHDEEGRERDREEEVVYVVCIKDRETDASSYLHYKVSLLLYI